MPEYLVRIPKPHGAQRRVLREAKRFNVVCLGRRSGKTQMGLLLAIRAMCLSVPVGWFAPKYQDLMESWRDLRQRLAPVTLERSEQSHRIAMMGGGTLECWSLEDPDAGRSRKYALVIMDEAAKARHLEQAWTAAIRPTLTDLKGSAWWLSTPKGLNYFHTLYQRGLDPTEPDFACWQMPTTCNPYIDPAEVEAARRELPSLVFQQEYLAQFVTFEGSVLRREWLRYGSPETVIRTVMAVDLAISTKDTADWTAAVVLSLTADGRIVVRAAERTRASFHDVLQFIRNMAHRWAPSVIAIESVQFQAAVVQELLRHTDLPVRGVKPEGKDKLLRFQPVAARYEQGLIWHVEGLPDYFEDELLSFPQGEHDDLVDAMAYAFSLVRLPDTVEYDGERLRHRSRGY